jgi:DNA repair protein RadC
MTERPHYHGHRQRLRERLLHEPKQLADYEVIESLLAYALPRRDTKPLAKELLRRFGTVRGVLQAKPEELRLVDGVGPGLEAFWLVLRELRARFDEAPLQEKVVFSTPRVVAQFAMSRLGATPTEEFWVALVDNRNRLMGWERVTRGTVDQAAVYPREVLRLVLERKAAGLVLVHNHPGGDPRPSQTDIEFTQRMRRAAAELDVRVLDHVIVTENDYFSFSAQGMLS